MARSITRADEQLKPDPLFGDKVLSRFINCVMRDGKKQVAQRIVYDAFKRIDERTGGEPKAIDVFHQAIDNIKPSVEVRTKRVGGANYQVPMQVNKKRQQSLAFRWVIRAARAEKGRPMSERLSRELYDAYRGEGKSIQTRDQTHRMAEANKAFAHFAW
jgi:small subunit ribosomal protein S7